MTIDTVGGVIKWTYDLWSDWTKPRPKKEEPKVEVEIVGKSTVRYIVAEGVMENVLDLFKENGAKQ